MMKKAPLLRWWSVAKGKGDDLTYYKKSIKIAGLIQVIYSVWYLDYNSGNRFLWYLDNSGDTNVILGR